MAREEKGIKGKKNLLKNYTLERVMQSEMKLLPEKPDKLELSGSASGQSVADPQRKIIKCWRKCMRYKTGSSLRERILLN